MEFCLLRVGLFGEGGDSFAIYPHQRDEFGLGWRTSKACKYSNYTCQLFLTQRREFFILGEPVFSNTTRLYPKISEDVPNNSKLPKKIIMLTWTFINRRFWGKYRHLLIIHGSFRFSYFIVLFFSVDIFFGKCVSLGCNSSHFPRREKLVRKREIEVFSPRT